LFQFEKKLTLYNKYIKVIKLNILYFHNYMSQSLNYQNINNNELIITLIDI